MAKSSTKQKPQVKRRAAALDLDSLPTGRGQDTVKVSEVLEVFNLADASNGKFVPIRIVDGFVPVFTHWLSTVGKEDKMYAFPKPCLSYDPETGRRDADVRCPYCEAEEWFASREVKVKVGKGEKNPAQCQTEYWTNIIPRSIQDDIDPRIATSEERESGFIQKGTKSRTPIRALRLTGGVVQKIRDVQETNMQRVKEKGKDKPVRKPMPVGHPQYGCDIYIKFDANAKSPGDFYGVQRGDPSPLTDEEKECLKWDIASIPFLNPIDSEDDAESEISRLKGKHWEKYRKFAKIADESSDYEDDEDDEDDEDEDEDESPRSKSKKGKASDKSKSKSKRRNDDEDEDEDDFDMDDEDEDDEDEDDDDLDDDEDEDEDDTPVRKKGKGSTSKTSGKKSSKKSSRYDEDEDDFDDEDDDLDDEDDDLDDEDDEDDEPPAKKGKKGSTSKASDKSKSKSKRRNDEDDDEDEDDDLDDDLDDDEDDEDDTPVRKKGKSSVSKSSKKKSSRYDEDDEDDEDEDDDLDDDEDEDDEPRKSKKGKASTKSKTKSKSKRRNDDDDEDDDLDDDDLPF